MQQKLFGTDTAKTAPKRFVKNRAEAAGDLIGNEIADKITSEGKSKSNKRWDKWNTGNLYTTRETLSNY